MNGHRSISDMLRMLAKQGKHRGGFVFECFWKDQRWLVGATERRGSPKATIWCQTVGTPLAPYACWLGLGVRELGPKGDGL